MFLDVFSGETLVKHPRVPEIYAKLPGCARHAGFRGPELMAEAIGLGDRRIDEPIMADL